LLMNDQDDAAHLSLSAASRMLGVHSTTLRRWADSGAIPVYITPGGHRRFARVDIETLASRRPLDRQSISSTWASKALAATRKELAETHARPRWLSHLDEEDRAVWRRIGQQLMGVVLRYINSPSDDEKLLAEARQIGADYALHARQVGMPLTAALEAALFFRDSLVDAAMDLPEEAHLRPEASARLLKRISRVANEVHLAVAASYQIVQ
jgi:excisionase family DNA binding protein